MADDRIAKKGGVVADGSIPTPAAVVVVPVRFTLLAPRISFATILHDTIIDGRLGAEILAYNPGIAVGYVWPVVPEAPMTMAMTVPMETPAATPEMLEPLIGRDPPPPLDLDALVVIVVVAVIVFVVVFIVVIIVVTDADEVPPFISGPDPAGLFGRTNTHNVLTPPFYASPILSPLVLVRNPPKSGATKSVAVAAEINKPDIEVKETGDDDIGGGVNFMIYDGSVFDGLFLVGGGHHTLHVNHDQYGEAEGGEMWGRINREKEGNLRQG